jgi:P-type Cu2+ transporter
MSVQPVACAHCGLPVPADLVQPDGEPSYCCQGCETVAGAIAACGLDRYYALKDTEGGGPALPTGRSYDELDDPSFHDLHVRGLPGGLLRTELYLSDVHCAACVWLVERLPFLREGCHESRLELRRGVVQVSWDPRQVQLSELARTLDSLGYPPRPASDAGQRERRRAEDRRHLLRIGIAGALAGNVMLFAFALYSGDFAGIEPEHRALFRWASMALTLVIVLGPGRGFLKGAFGALRARRAHMDLPIAIGISAGTAWGTVNTFRGTGEVYFDTVSVLIFLLLLGRWLQHRQRRRAHDAVEELFSLTPAVAHRIEGDQTRDVPVQSLRQGDRVRVLAGETVPADGRLLEGTSSFDLGVLTGESRPVPVSSGASVQAGTTNLSAAVVLEVETTGEATRLGRLLALVERAAERRAPVERLADRVAAWFVVAVIVLAALTALLWLWIDPARAVENAVALLIITCPCALGLATPLALVASVGRAARHGILIKGGEALEALSHPGLAWLDKTGTLTEGRTAVLHWEGPQELLATAAALERDVAHPVARAILQAAADTPLPSPGPVRVFPRGVQADLDGVSVALGSRAWIESLGATTPTDLAAAATRWADAGVSPVLLAIDGEVRAVAGCGDPIRTEAAASLRQLEARGWTTGVLSGDHPAVVASVASQLGILDGMAHGGVSPEDKLAQVESSMAQGPVIMVGDGVNDAAALSAATVGVAVHGGAEASLAAADVYLTRPGLEPLVELLDGARATMGIIRRNLAVSLVYNLVGASLAMSGVITPLVAAVLMPISSLTVVTLSYRSKSFPDPR